MKTDPGTYGAKFARLPRCNPYDKFKVKGGFWRSLCSTPGYRAWQEKSRYNEAAAELNRVTGDKAGHVLSLGTGLGIQEEILLRHIQGVRNLYIHEIDYPEAGRVTCTLGATLNLMSYAVWGEFEDPRLHLPPSDLVLLLGNHIGNLPPERALSLLNWIRRSQRSGGYFVLEWTTNFAGDWRHSATRFPTTEALRETVGVERQWYTAVGTSALKARVRISLHPHEFADGGYELTFIAKTRDGRRIVVAEFYRYTVATMQSLCRAAGYDPVPDGLWQQGPSTILLLKAI